MGFRHFSCGGSVQNHGVDCEKAFSKNVDPGRYLKSGIRFFGTGAGCRHIQFSHKVMQDF
jgi:hypothetical protein